MIDQLVAACLDIDSQLLEGLPRIQLDHGVKMDRLRALEQKKVRRKNVKRSVVQYIMHTCLACFLKVHVFIS